MTIYDIAKLANVSKTTVSRVINGDNTVKEDTRDIVLKIIKETNYSPNKSARMLNKNSTKTLLVIMTRLNSKSEYDTVRGIINSIGEQYELMLFESNFNIDTTKKIVENHPYVDGIVIFAKSAENYNFLNDINKEVIYVGQKIYNKKSVYYNDKDAIDDVLKLATKKKVIRNAIYCGVENEDYTTGNIRQSAAELYCVENNINIKLLNSSFDSLDSFNLISNVNLDDIDLIICATDRIALGIYKHLLKLNKNILLTGVGNFEQINFIIDNFITVDLNHYLSGYKVVELLKSDNISYKMDYEVIDKT